mgnify:FL=1
MANILIVDDAEIIRISISRYMEKLGHTIVAIAVNGDEAISQYKEYSPDLVLMGISMPEINGVKDGIDALCEIMKINTLAKVVMVTSQGEQRLVMEAISKGAKGYILKPVSKEKLKSILDKLDLT